MEARMTLVERPASQFANPRPRGRAIREQAVIGSFWHLKSVFGTPPENVVDEARASHKHELRVGK